MELKDLLNLEDVFDCERTWKRTIKDKRFHMQIAFIDLLSIYREHWNDVNQSHEKNISFEGMLSQSDIEALIQKTQLN
jgi:hypothetical protein